MSKISELGPIKGANTRSEDLFVIVNLIQGDDGTKNITRKELVQAIQYEIFDRITITGGKISNVTIFNTIQNDNSHYTSVWYGGRLEAPVINAPEIYDGSADNIAISNSTIDGSDFSNGTGNNDVFTNSRIDYSEFSNGTGSNNYFSNSTIDNSYYANVTIEQGTANGLILTNITIDELVLEDALISNSTIITTSFSNGTIFDTAISNSSLVNTSISNSDIRDTDLDNVDITNSRFHTNGMIWDTAISNSTIVDTQVANTTIVNSFISDSIANNISIDSSSITNSTGDGLVIVNSDFSDGTGNNNVFTNTTIDQGVIQNSVIANTQFQGVMDNVVATNMSIGSSTSDGLSQQRSTIQDSDISDSNIANSIIEDSQLVDFDMDLTKAFEAPLDEDSYFALKNVKTGEVEQMTFRQVYEEFSRKTDKALKVYVEANGNDEYPGTLLQPVRTLKRAGEIALEKAGGSYNRNDIDHAIHISVGPGVYWIDEPVALPDDCSISSTAGQYATLIRKKPGWERTNGILVGSGCYAQGFSYMNFEVDNFDYPEGGFAIAYRPGALLRRSPYIRDSSQLSNYNRLDVEPPLNPFNSKGSVYDLGQEFYLELGHSAQSNFQVDDEVTFSSGASGYVSYIDDIDANHQIYVRNLKGNVAVGDILYARSGGTGTVSEIGIDDFPNREVGRGGGNLLADRRVLDPDSLFTYVLCFGFTPRSQNGVGYVARDGAGVNGIGSLSIFSREAFFALNGGQMTLNNSGSQFGDISMRSKGKTVIIRPESGNETLVQSNTPSGPFGNTAFGEELTSATDDILNDMVAHLVANTSSGGLGYQGYDADKCYRDTGIIVDNTGYDIAANSNYWGRLSGITYRSPISYVVANEQLTETVGSIEHIKGEMNFIFENANTVINDRINTSIDETLNVLQNGEEFANPIVFTDTGNGSATGAREVVQDNRSFIIEEFVDWMDNNPDFFAYDSDKCKRDVREYILPAVKYDALLDTNYNSVTAGYAYYFNATKNVIGEQRNETIAAYEHLREKTIDVTEANSAPFTVEAYDKFNEIIDILKRTGDKYTPTNATYDPATGRAVLTIGAHDLEEGRYIFLNPESLIFSCNTDGNVLQYAHPRSSDPAFRSAMPIIETTPTTITLDVGKTGYNGVHTFVKALDKAVVVLGNKIYFSDSTDIPADNRNARKQLQDNKAFIQDYMMNWADNEWFFYDSNKCQRDTNEYIVPAALRDMQLGTNFNAIQNGVAYRQAISKAVPNTQFSETVGAFSHLRDSISDTMSDPIAIHGVTKAMDEIIGIMQTGGRKYTPSDATYDPVTGIAVLTIGSHDFAVGDQFVMEKEALTFACANTTSSPNFSEEISHPRVTDPAYKTPVTITGITDTTITANVGDAGGYTGAHTFLRAKLNSIQKYEVLNNAFNVSNATYDPATGVAVLTIGDHSLNIGDQVTLDAEALTFTCANTTTLEVVEISHPRATDPAYNTPITITDTGATTITLNVGDANGYTGAHTFLFAKPNSVKKYGIYTAKFTPTDATYDPVTGDTVLTIGQHTLQVGKWISIAPESITFACGTGEIAHPRATDPAAQAPVRITAVTSNTITVNVGNAGGYTGAHTFVRANPDCIDTNAIYWTDPAKRGQLFTPQTATYNPVTGDMVITLGADHGITTDDHVEFKPQSVVFQCDSPAVQISHPRIGEPNYQVPLAVSAADATTITVNVGSANGYTGTHTFVSAEPGCLIKTPTGVTRDGTLARKQLQDNRTFIMNNVDDWIRSNYFVYKKDQCQRDTGLILNAVARDVLTGSNLHSIFNGLAYRSSKPAVNSVIQNELTETVGSLNWLKGEIAGTITDSDSITSSNEAFDEIIDIMEHGNWTPTNATYDPVTGVAVLTIGNHNFVNGDTVYLKPYSITFECGTPAEQISHPRAGDPAYNSPVTITGTTATSITINVGNAGGYTGAHTFVRSEFGSVTTFPERTFGSSYVSEEAYEAGRALQANKKFMIDRATSFIKNKFPDLNYDSTLCKRDVGWFVDAVTWDIQHGSNAATVNNSRMYYDNAVAILPTNQRTPTAETFEYIANLAGQVVRNEVADWEDYSAFDVTDATYDPSTGESVLTIGTHNMKVGDNIRLDIESLSFTCDTDGNTIVLSHPRTSDPAAYVQVAITAATATTITINVGGTLDSYAGVHTFTGGPSVGAVKYANVQQMRSGGTAFNVTDATYDPVSGIAEFTIGDHQFKVGDSFTMDELSITFQCDSPAVQISHPRATDPFGGNKACMITAVSPTTITANVGNAGGYTGTHTFVSATAGAIKSSDYYTPDNVSYNPATGIAEITLPANHGFVPGDRILIAENSLTFSCDTGPELLSHPRPTDPAWNKALSIISVTDVTITVQVGSTSDGYAGVHTLQSAADNCIQKVTAPASYTPSDAAYDPTTGICTLTLGNHRLQAGDWVVMDKESITFSCQNPPGDLTVVNISHPRATDPYFNRPCKVIKATTTTITLDVGAAPDGYNGVHTFVSAELGCVKTSTPPEVAHNVVDLFSTVANMIRGQAFEELPALIEPSYDSSVFNFDSGRKESSELIIGSVPKYQWEVVDYIREKYNGLAYDTDLCYRDVGLLLDAISEDLEYGGNAATIDAATYYFNNAVNILPYDQREPTRLAFEHLGSVASNVIQQNTVLPTFGSSFTPTGAAYNPATGVFTATIGAHSLEVGDYVWLEEESIRFTCDTDGNVTVLAHPRAGEKAHEKPVKILGTTATTISMQVGWTTDSYAGVHTFDSADANAVKEVVRQTVGQSKDGAAGSATIASRADELFNVIAGLVDNRNSSEIPEADADTMPLIEPSRTYARKSLQANKAFIQDEVVAYINDEFFVYDEAKCARDVNYIIDAVARDVQTGSDYNSKLVGMVYRSGNPGTANVINNELPETIAAIKWMKADIESRLVGVAKTRATTAFDNIISIMKTGDLPTTFDFGSAYMATSARNATDGLQVNRQFLIAEGTAWIAQTYPVLALTYDSAKCARDIGFMIDALSFDIRNGSNCAIRDVARQYFENGLQILSSSERAETAAVYVHLAQVAESALLKQTIVPTTGNPYTPSTSFSAVTAVTAQRVQDLWAIVSNAITQDSLINMEDLVEPNDSGSGVGYSYEVETAAIRARKSALSSSVNTYLQQTFDYLEYDQDKCRRDIGYMVDAVSHDIQYGGNSAMWNASQIYFVNAVNLLPMDQRKATQKAFTHMAKVMRHVIRNEEVPLRNGRSFNVTGATYDPASGFATYTLDNNTLRVGDYIMQAPESVTFDCGEGLKLSHPRVTDPSYKKPLEVLASTGSTITVYVGFANGYTGTHTFISAIPDALIYVKGQSQKQDMGNVAARRDIADEAMNLAMMVANIAYDNNPTNIPFRVEPKTNWMWNTLVTEKDKVDNTLTDLVKGMVSFISAEYKGISYPKQKCRRDVGIIVDALSHDVQYQTNYATRLVANMYFDNAVSVLPHDQRTQTADFYDVMSTLVSNVIQGTETGQVLDNSAATATEGEWAADMVRIVEEAIRRDSLDAVPEIIEPYTAYVPADMMGAATEIDNNLDQLADKVTDYIKENFSIIDYSKAKCRRDAGYLIDAMSWDLNYGGNLASRWNADFYYWNNVLRIPEEQRVATAKAYRQLGKIVSEVAVGKYAGQKLRPEMGAEEQRKQAYDLGMIFYNVLFFNTPKALGQKIEPNWAWESDKVFKFSKDILTNNRDRLQKEVQRFITVTYKFIDLPKTYRDGANLLGFIANDVSYRSAGSQLYGGNKATRAFTAALFNIDAKHVFPVFNPPMDFPEWRKLRFKGTETNLSNVVNPKPWDTYIVPINNNDNRYDGVIHYYNGFGWVALTQDGGYGPGRNNIDLLNAFTGAWTQMKTYINNNIAPDLAHENMITELFDNVLTASVIRPNFLAFGSLVESIAHQFNGASAGVNRNALPLNFRNIGAAISATASVLSEDGGRIRWSGSDELNNQYFARGLKINGRTGRIEGRPFTSSVRKLARRASNSRAAL